jgi:hypothetical protein
MHSTAASMAKPDRNAARRASAKGFRSVRIIAILDFL